MTKGGEHSGPPFRTIRLLGEKAQQILEAARTKLKHPEEGLPTFTVERPAAREPQPIAIAPFSLVKAALAVIGVLLLLVVLYHLRGTILLLALSVFLATVIDPGVSFLERWHVPRSLAVLLVYVAAVTILLFLLLSLVPIIAMQIQQIVSVTAASIDRFLQEPSVEFPFLPPVLNASLTEWTHQFVAEILRGGLLQALQQFGERLSFAAQGSLVFVVNLAGSVVNFFVNFTLVLVFTYFFQLEKEKWSHRVLLALPYTYRKYVGGKAHAIHAKIAQWVQGQMVLCLSIGLLTFIGLAVLRVPYALTLAVLAGFMEFIPYVGPFLAAIPAVLIGFTQVGLLMSFWIVVVYVIIQQLENNIFVPLVMKHSVGLSPIAVLVAVLVGVSFPDTIHPVLGIILAVPAAAVGSIFLNDVLVRRR